VSPSAICTRDLARRENAPDPVSDKLLEKGRQNLGRVDHQVATADDSFRLPQAVGTAPLKGVVKRGILDQRGSNDTFY